MDDVYKAEPTEDVVADAAALGRGDVLSLRLPCTTEYYRVCRLMISGLAQKLGLPWDAVEDLKLAVSEGCSLVSGGASDHPATLEMQVHIHSQRLEIVLQGPGPLHASDQEDLVDGRAMGLFFVQSLMDEVQYQTTKLHMVKHLGT